MRNIRVIARLDIKNNYLIKGIHLEGLRKVGDPHEFSKKYYNQNIDEILYMDAVASLYGRNSLLDLIKRVSRDVFIPLTVGGGIRSIHDATEILRSGADKIAINTAAIKDPSLIESLSKRFGAQCIVLSVEAKRKSDHTWEAMTDNGREHSGLDVIDWVREACTLGAGEVLVTSIDNEGTRKGFDVELMRQVSTSVTVPIIASGGFGKNQDLVDVVKIADVNAVSIAHDLHYAKTTIDEVKNYAIENGINLRRNIL